MSIRIYKDTLAPSLTDTINVNGAAFDLTGSTVKLKMRASGSDAGDILKIDAAATIVSAAAGTVRYDWAAGDVDTAGDYVAWWEITLPSTDTQDSVEFLVEILEHGSISGALCTVDQVRRYLSKGSDERGQDGPIEDFIARASAEIIEWTSREFTPTASATRRFRVRNRFVDLAPYDLRTVTTMTLDPDDAATVLTAGTHYALEPLPSQFGVYYFVRLADTLGITSTHSSAFGYSLLEIAGDWGFASVPEVVEHAAIVTVAKWIRGSSHGFAPNFDEPDQPIEVPMSLPGDVRAMLSNFRRRGIV